MKIIFFIMFYTIMYIKRSFEKEIDLMKSRRIRMTISTRDIYMKSSLKNSEFEDLLKTETTLNNPDLTMGIILCNINYMNNILANSLKEKKVLIRLKFQVISYDLSTIDELIIHYGFNAADDNLYVNSNGNFNYILDVTYKIGRINQQQCNRKKDNSYNNENSNMPIQFRLGRNLKSVIMPRDFQRRLEYSQTNDPLRTYHYADSKERKDFSDQLRFKKGKNVYYSSRTSRLSEQRRPGLFNKGSVEKQSFFSIQKANLRRSNGIEITKDSDVEKKATVYVDTLRLLSTFMTTNKYNFINIDHKSHWSDVAQILSSKVGEDTTLSSLDIYKYESSTMDYNYYVDYNLKADQEDYDEYEYDYEEPMEDIIRWYDYFEENVTFTTTPTEIDPDKLHTEPMMTFVTRTDFILTSETNYFYVEATTDSIVPATLLPLIETAKATTLTDDTLSLVVTKAENDKTFTQVERTTTESTTEYTITPITRQSYVSEIDNEEVKIITTQITVSVTVKSVNKEATSSLIVEETATVPESIADPLLFKETRAIITYEIIKTTTLPSQTFEKSTIIEPSLVFTFSTIEHVADMEFITEMRREEINKSEIITDNILTSTEIIISSYVTTHREIIETRVSSFTSSTGTSIITSIVTEDETEKTALEVLNSSSSEGTTLSMRGERTGSVKLGKTHTVFRETQVEESTGTYIPDIMRTTIIATLETKVEASTRTIAIENIFTTFTPFIPEIIETEEETSEISSEKTLYIAFTVTPKEIEGKEGTATIAIDKFRTAFTTSVPEITQAKERTSVITSKKIHVGCTITPKMSQIKGSISTNMPEIIDTSVTVTSDIFEEEESTSTITLEQFLTIFTIIPRVPFVEEVLETSIISVITPISSEVTSIIDEWRQIITNRTVFPSSTVTMNRIEKIIILTEIEDKLISTSIETSLTLTKISQRSDTSSVSSSLEMHTFTMAPKSSSATTNYDTDIASSSIFTETTIPSSEITFISSISSYSDSYSQKSTFGVSLRETYLLTTISEAFVTLDTDWTIFQILEKTLPLSYSITSADISTVIEEISQPKSIAATLSTLTELKIYRPTSISSTYFKTEETRMLTETTVKVETIQQHFAFINFETDVTTLSTFEELDLSSASEIMVLVSNFTDVYYLKETLFATTQSTDFPMLLTSPSRNISLTFFSKIEYPSTFAPFFPTITSLTKGMFQSFTRSTLIDKQTSVASSKSSEAIYTDKIITKVTKIEDYEEPEKFYDIDYGEDFREAYEDEVYTDKNETVTKWYDYDEEEEGVTFDRETTTKISKIIEEESISKFSIKFIITDATIMTFPSEKSTGTSFGMETTATTEIFISLSSLSETSKTTNNTSDISLAETYRTSYEMERTTMIGEYEMSTILLTSTPKTTEGFETLTTEIISSVSLYDTIEEWYTLTTNKIFLYTTDHLEWWINISTFKTSDYTLTRSKFYNEKNAMYVTLPKFLTSPDETSTNIDTEPSGQYTKLELNASELVYDFTNENGSTIYIKEIATTSLLLFTDSWSVKETSKMDIVIETEELSDSTVTNKNADFERTATSAKYINRKEEEEITSTIPSGESSSLVVEVETTGLKLYSPTFFDLVPSLVTDILDKTSGKTDQEEKLRNLMDEIKRTENREKRIKEKEEEQRIIETDFEQRKGWKEMEEKERKDSTNFLDITHTTSSTYDETTMSESIELLSINDIFTTYAFIALQSTSAITIEPMTSDSSLRRQALQQEIERLKEELQRRKDKLEERERQLQERKEKFEKERKEYEENLQREFGEKTGQGMTLLPIITDQSVLISSSSTKADYANTTHKLCLLSTISSARTLSSSTFKPPVELELFTPAPPTEKTTSISRYLHRVEIACKECEKRSHKDSVGRGKENFRQIE